MEERKGKWLADATLTIAAAVVPNACHFRGVHVAILAIALLGPEFAAFNQVVLVEMVQCRFCWDDSANWKKICMNFRQTWCAIAAAHSSLSRRKAIFIVGTSIRIGGTHSVLRVLSDKLGRECVDNEWMVG